MVRLCRFLAGLEVLIMTFLLMFSSAAKAQPANVPIDHIIIIYLENHSFDNPTVSSQGPMGLISLLPRCRRQTKMARSTNLAATVQSPR